MNKIIVILISLSAIYSQCNANNWQTYYSSDGHNMKACNLLGADLSGENLTEANLEGADVENETEKRLQNIVPI